MLYCGMYIWIVMVKRLLSSIVYSITPEVRKMKCVIQAEPTLRPNQFAEMYSNTLGVE